MEQRQTGRRFLDETLCQIQMRNKTATSILLLLMGVCLLSCISYLSGDEKLSLEMKQNLSSKLRLDGYYVHIDSQQTKPISLVFFLYNNGVLQFVGTLESSQYDTLRNFLQSPPIRSWLQKDKSSWGLYQIKGDSIIYEKWFLGGGFDMQVFRFKGIILNDTTFIITQSEQLDGSERTRKNATYHFKKFHPKPDSVNVFIPELVQK